MLFLREGHQITLVVGDTGLCCSASWPSAWARHSDRVNRKEQLACSPNWTLINTGKGLHDKYQIKMTCSSSASWPEVGSCENHYKAAPRVDPYLREYMIDILWRIKVTQLLTTRLLKANIMGMEVTTMQEIRKKHCHMQQTDSLGRAIRKGASHDPGR